MPSPSAALALSAIEAFSEVELATFWQCSVPVIRNGKGVYDEGKGNFPGKSSVGYAVQTRVCDEETSTKT
jgi:hypothetical protein